MNVTFSTNDNIPVATLTGGLNAIHVERLRLELTPWLDTHETSPLFLMDFAGVQMMDSSGLGLLIGLLKTLRTRDAALHICGAAQKVKMVFHVTRTQNFFTFHDSMQAAMTSFAEDERG